MKYLLLLLLVSISSFFEAQTLEDDFEGSETISTWSGDDCGIDTSFSNPFQLAPNPSATVLKYSDTGGTYANIRFNTSSNLDLTTKNTFSIKIYVSEITGRQVNKVSLKLQNNTLAETWVTQTEIIKPINLNQWQTVVFDFKNNSYVNFDSNSPAPITRSDFNRVLIQVNGENNSDTVVAYIDDFSYYESTTTNDGETEGDPVFNTLVWSDEFNESGTIDSEKWFQQTRPIINGQSWANGEIQHYTNRVDNSYMSNGSLKILAKKETYTNLSVTKDYTSARLNSKFAFTHGKIQIRAKMPIGVGTFPALWMLGQNIDETGGYWAATHGTTSWPSCGEIDIIEHWGTNQNFVQSALHNQSSSGGTVNKGGRSISDASTEFHLYTLEWNANKMIFSVDNIKHYTYNPENKNGQNWPYDAPQYLLFNVAILPEISSTFTESAMEIDYVRVYQESVASSSSFLLKEISMYPNPINDKLTIKTEGLFQAIGTIYSITGSKVNSFSIEKTTQVIDCSNLKKGVYFLKLESKTKTDTFKIIKN